MLTSDLDYKYDSTIDELVLNNSISDEPLPELGGPSTSADVTHFREGPPTPFTPRLEKRRSASQKFNDSSISDDSLGSSTATKQLVNDSSGDELSLGIGCDS